MTDLSPLESSPPWRWVASLAVVLTLHAGAFVMLMQAAPPPEVTPPVDAVMLDLTPAAEPAPPTPVAPPAPATPPQPTTEPPPVAQQPPPPTPPDPTPPDPAPPDPTPPDPAPPDPPPPVEPPPPPPKVEPEVALPMPVPPPPPPPKVIPRVARPPVPRHQAPPPPRVEPQPSVTAPAPAPPTPPPAAAAAPSAPAGPTAATWASQLFSHLLKFRHYPPEAERRGFTGRTVMRISIDLSGHIVSSVMVQSSGHEMLDEEAAAWLQRAQPLPPPPPDKAAPAQITIPLSFTLH